MAPFPSLRYDEKSFPGLWPANEPRLRKEPFSTMDEMDLAIAERAVELCMTAADRTLGVLSLSACVGEQMWAYYANDHRGVAMGFNETHPFFGKNARPIVYSDEPLHVTANSGWVGVGGIKWDNNDILEGNMGKIPLALFFRKRLGWAHETEWRMIQPLAHGIKMAGEDQNGHAVHLFEVPAASLQKVLFGYRASDELVESTHRQISREARWNHVGISRRRRLKTGRIEEECLR
jgi:hypothetical protein